MKLSDLLDILTEDTKVCVRGGSFDEITASPDDLLHIAVYKVVNAKVIEALPVGKEIIQVWVDENELGE